VVMVPPCACAGSRDSCAGSKMFTARKKIVKEKGAEPDEFEEGIDQVWSGKLLQTRSDRTVAAAAAHRSHLDPAWHARRLFSTLRQQMQS